MQRIRVDLPEPEGPQITMRSPRRTTRSMSFNAWKLPNHLLDAAHRDDDVAKLVARLSAVFGRHGQDSLMWPPQNAGSSGSGRPNHLRWMASSSPLFLM